MPSSSQRQEQRLVRAQSFLANWTPSRLPSDETLREDEPWSTQTESLLHGWSRDWSRRVDAHSLAEEQARSWHLLLQLPTVLIPMVIAPLLCARVLLEDNLIVLAALLVSSLMGALQSVLGLERKSEQHSQAAIRYGDLLSEAEEVLAKSSRFRPQCDVTIKSFQLRMSSVHRYAPPLSPLSSSSSSGSEE